jgi:pilus assembly protein CpaE
MDNALILVVEDSEITLFKLKAILMRLGYSVVTHTNPIEALQWLAKSEKKPDLIMSDLMMPKMDGIEFVRKVRAYPATARTPVIMLTSRTDMDNKIAGMQAGADDYLSKTVTPTELELRVKALLARSQTSEGTFSQSVAKTISVFSLRGGVGKTSISVNLSIALAQLWGIGVTLWDMALSSGHCASFLNLHPKNTLTSLHDWPDDAVEESLMAQLLTKHETGIQLMSAPLSPADAELVTPRTVDQVWSYLQGNSSYLVVDAGSQFTDAVMTILERSDLILLVLAPEIASVKSTADALEIFEKLGYDLSKVLLVINSIFPGQWLPSNKIMPMFKNRYAYEIPYDSERFVHAIVNGKPLVSMAPKSEAGMAIISLAYKLSLRHMETAKKTGTTPMLEWVRKQKI